MFVDTIYLREHYPFLPETQQPAELETYCRASQKQMHDPIYPAMLVLPGGGYSHLSGREGEPIALDLLARGIQCFVLSYALTPDHYPIQLWQVAAAVDYIRRNAARYSVDPRYVGVMGFSAGGHLAGSYCTLWQDEELFAPTGIPAEVRRPTAMGLIYAVLSSGKYCHGGSFRNLLGEENMTPELLEKLSVEKQISELTPQAFLFHTAADGSVPVQNSLLVAKELADRKIPFEMHIAPIGGHGLAACDSLTAIRCSPDSVPIYADWVNKLADWYLRLTGYPTR